MIDRERRQWLKDSFGEETVTEIIEAEDRGAGITYPEDRSVDSRWVRIDEDPQAETGDTRIRVREGENDTYELIREEYSLSVFPGPKEEIGYEKYDWSRKESFVLYGDSEAKQFAGMLEKADAFDPNVLFFRQREIPDDGGDE